MPTAKPRITITLSDDQHRLLSTLGELQGESMSSIVVDLLESVRPPLERLVQVLQAAKDAPENVRKELKKSAEIAEAEHMPLVTSMVGQLDLMLQMVAGSQVRASEPGRPAAKLAPVAKAPRPPATNRGVRIPLKSSISPFNSSTKVKVGKKGKK
jgi:uncharacterized membrane protein YccC